MNGFRGRGRGQFGGGVGGGGGGGGGGFQGGRGGGMGRGGGGGPRQRRQEDKEQFKKLFIGGLSFDTTSESLREHFSHFGDVVDCVVMKDAKTQKPKGFGFITYQLPESVDSVQDGRPHNLDGRVVDTKRAMPKEDAGKPECKESTKKIFLGGLSPEASEEDVKLICEEFGGAVEKVDVIRDKETGKGKGFGFVTFHDTDKVDKIYLKGSVDICGRSVEVKKAVEKNKLNAGGDAGGGNYNRGGGGGGGGMGGGMYGGQQQQQQQQQQSYGGYNSGGAGAYSAGGGYGAQGYASQGYLGQQTPYSGGGGGYSMGGGASMGSGYEASYSAGPVRAGGSYQQQQQRPSPYGAGSYSAGAAGGGYSTAGGYNAGGAYAARRY